MTSAHGISAPRLLTVITHSITCYTKIPCIPAGATEGSGTWEHELLAVKENTLSHHNTDMLYHMLFPYSGSSI